MNQQLIPLGIIVILIGFALVLFGILNQTNKNDSKSSTKVAVGGFIGFIPFGFGNDKDMVKITIAISVLFFLAWIVFHFYIGAKLR